MLSFYSNSALWPDQFAIVILGNEDSVCQLHLEISSVQFSHHPLFSCEHVISSCLEQAYQHYCNRDEKAADYYNEKVTFKAWRSV